MPRITELYNELKSLGLMPQEALARTEEESPEAPLGDDMDIYDVLVGSSPTSKENQKAVANALRKRRSMGEIGMVSGDEVLGNMGSQMIRSSDSAADQIQRNRQQDIDNAQTRRYQQGQLDHMGGLLGESKRNNTMDFLTQALSAEASMERANNPRGGKPPRLRVGDINNLRENANAQGTIQGTMDFMNKGGRLGQVEMAGIPVPMLRQTLNAAAKMGLGTDDTKNSQLQWQNYKRFYELAERNNLFGATLTTNEQNEWRSANPSVAQTDEQIMSGLKIMAKVYENAGDSFAAGLGEEGYDPEAIQNYRHVQNVEVGGGEGETVEQPRTDQGPAPKRVKMTAQDIADIMRSPSR